MEIKKNTNVDLENKKSIFFKVGFVLTLALVYFMFEYSTAAGIVPDMTAQDIDEEKEEVMITMQKPPELTPPPPPPVINTMLKIVTDITDIEDGDLEFDTEPEDNTATKLFTEEIKEKEEVILTIAQEMPEFPGGMRALLKYISKNTKYPDIAREQGIQGKVYIRFVVTKEGKVEKVSVARKADQSLDNEAIRVVKTLPKWMPGRNRGKPVNVWYTLPIDFTLQD